MVVCGNQIKAARALLGLEQIELAVAAGVSVNTLRSMEASGRDQVSGRIDTINKIAQALKLAGVIFIAENGEGPGVRLRKDSIDRPGQATS